MIVSQILLATKVGGEGDLGHALAWAAGALTAIVTSYVGMKTVVFRGQKRST